MSTAREDARDAVRQAYFSADDPTNRVLADAASDVWEPLLRNLLTAVELDFSPHRSRGKSTYEEILRVREALGE